MLGLWNSPSQIRFEGLYNRVAWTLIGAIKKCKIHNK
jgi:hypothetical protein